jgi:hypothetical protein
MDEIEIDKLINELCREACMLFRSPESNMRNVIDRLNKLKPEQFEKIRESVNREIEFKQFELHRLEKLNHAIIMTYFQIQMDAELE